MSTSDNFSPDYLPRYTAFIRCCALLAAARPQAGSQLHGRRQGCLSAAEPREYQCQSGGRIRCRMGECHGSQADVRAYLHNQTTPASPSPSLGWKWTAVASIRAESGDKVDVTSVDDGTAVAEVAGVKRWRHTSHGGMAGIGGSGSAATWITSRRLAR